MPYSRKTPRRLRRHLVTLAELDRTNQQVTGEMERLGLWSDALAEVGVWLVPVSLDCYGWHSGTPGSISIPAVSFASLGDYLRGDHVRLADVLRHEWAHALADRMPKLVYNADFRRVFGGSYASPRPVWEYHPDLHLTRYAATCPCEDFAETFHFYLRHKGRLPLRLSGKREIVRKWRFVARMARAMAKAGASANAKARVRLR